MFASAAAVPLAGIRTCWCQRALQRLSTLFTRKPKLQLCALFSGEGNAQGNPLSLRERAGVRVKRQNVVNVKRYMADAGASGGVAQRQSGGLISPRL